MCDITLCCATNRLKTSTLTQSVLVSERCKVLWHTVERPVVEKTNSCLALSVTGAGVMLILAGWTSASARLVATTVRVPAGVHQDRLPQSAPSKPRHHSHAITATASAPIDIPPAVLAWIGMRLVWVGPKTPKTLNPKPSRLQLSWDTPRLSSHSHPPTNQPANAVASRPKTACC